MAELNTEEPLSNGSENSFVILGQGSLPLSVNFEYSNNGLCSVSKERNESTSSFKLGESPVSELIQSRLSESPSFNENEAQEKLNQLMTENYHLRETLNQNNVAIKSQLDTFVMWQQEVLKIHECHKQKFLETKELILKLKAENSDLKKQLLETVMNVSYLNVPANSENVTSIKETISEDLSRMNQDMNYREKCEALVAKNENLSAENYKFREELKNGESKIFKLNKDLEDVLRENKFLKEKEGKNQINSIENFSYTSLPNSEARAQIANLNKQLEEEKAKVSKLKEELQKVKTEKSEVTPEFKLKTSEELDHCINKLDNMNVSFDLQSQRFSSIMSWVSLAEENLQTLKDTKADESTDCLIASEITQLKNHLSQEINSFRKKQESLQEIHGQFQVLLEDYKELQQKVKFLESNDENIQKYKNEIQALSEEINNKNKDLASKQKECDGLKANVKRLNLECEEIALLRIQLFLTTYDASMASMMPEMATGVQIYRTDFSDEKAAREKLVGEKEVMLEQIRALQTKIEEFESKKNSSENTSAEPPSEKKKSRYICPKCMFSFSDLKRCEEHVEECLNIHFYP